MAHTAKEKFLISDAGFLGSISDLIKVNVKENAATLRGTGIS